MLGKIEGRGRSGCQRMRLLDGITDSMDMSLIPGSGRTAGQGIGYLLQYSWAFLVVQLVKNPPALWETWVQSLCWEVLLEKGKATHSRILAGEFHGPYSPRGHRVEQDWAIFTFTYCFIPSISSVQLLSRVWLFATPWITARQASLSITNSRSLLKLMSVELVMPSSHLILCCPLLLLPPVPPSIRVFSSESTLCMRWQKYWSFSFSIRPSNEHPVLIPLGWTGWISLQSKRLSRVFSNTTVQKHQFFSAQLSSQSKSHIHTWALEIP